MKIDFSVKYLFQSVYNNYLNLEGYQIKYLKKIYKKCKNHKKGDSLR